MGMMTRRNVRARVATVAPAVVEKKVVKEEVKSDSLVDKIKAKGLSKTDINKMSTADLQKLAKEFDIEGADELSGNQIKKMLNGALGE